MELGLHPNVIRQTSDSVGIVLASVELQRALNISTRCVKGTPSLMTSVNSLLNWHRTPQGSEFWALVHYGDWCAYDFQ